MEGRKILAHVTITTYSRPEKCLFTLQQLEGVQVSVFRDRCDKDYSRVEQYCKEKGYHYHVTDKHLGKWRYYELHNIMYEYLDTQDFDYYIQIPDDALLVDNFVPRAIALLEDDLSCVGLFTTKGQIQKHVRTQKRPTKKVNGEVVIEVGWLDCCLVTTKRVMDGFRIHRNIRSRRQNPIKSSGVGWEQAAAYHRKTGRKAQLSYYALVVDYFEYEGGTVMHTKKYLNIHHVNKKKFSLKRDDRQFIEKKYRRSLSV